MGICALVVTFWNSSRSQPLPVPGLLVAILAPGTVIGFAFGLARYRCERLKPALRDDSAHAEARVLCYASKDDNPLFLEIVPELFEPVIFKYIDGLSTPFWSRMRYRHPELAFGGPILLTLGLLAYKWYLGAAMFVLIFAGNRLPLILRPRYLRVMPGMIEVLVAPSGKESVTPVQRLCLHSPRRIDVLLNEGVVRLVEPDGTGSRTITIGLGGVEDPRAAAIAIARAAMAPPTDARPPEDSLCG